MSVTRAIKNNIGAGAIIPQIEKFGDWPKAHRLLGTIDGVLKNAMARANKSIADKLRAQVRKNIRENGASIGWEPLAVGTRLKKAKLGQDPDRILYATGLYYRSITIWKVGINYYVGVKRGIKHGNGNLTVGEIARIHESGRGNIPARPLWSPSYRQMGGSKRVKGILLWHIRNQIYLAYGIRPKITL